MSQRRRLGLTGFGAGLLVLTWATSAFCANVDSWYIEGALRKLGRGLVNVVTSPGELVRMTEIVGRRDGYVAASSVGILQGLWRTVLRAGAGVYDAATFFAEVPANFEPVVEPEFVFAHGNWAQDDN